MAKKLFVFELFYSEEEAALRGTPIAVYESAPVDAEIERLNGKLEAAEELAAAAMADLKALRGADEPGCRETQAPIEWKGPSPDFHTHVHEFKTDYEMTFTQESAETVKHERCACGEVRSTALPEKSGGGT